MSETPRPSVEREEAEMEQLIGRLLQFGVLLAAAVVIVGGTALLLHSGGDVADFRIFVGATSPLHTLTGIGRGVLALHADAIVQLGLVLLIATPVARVALTLVAFIVQRDRMYVAVTALVLVLLLYGLIWGKA